MKAKEYYQKLTDMLNEELIGGSKNDFHESLAEIAMQYLDEIKEIVVKRRASCDSAFAAIIKEQDNKWQAMCRMSPRLNKMGNIFLWALEKDKSEFYAYLIKHGYIRRIG